MNGLAFLNIELTSKCDKSCWMCGRRKLERDYPELCNWGDMPKEMVSEISKQTPKDIVVQFHNNGESLLYPDLGWALSLFRDNIRCFDTNGKLLLEKADEIIGNLDTLTISVIQDDSEGDEQYDIICKFLSKRNGRKPLLVYRLLGNIKDSYRWGQLEGTVCKRILHRSEGSFGYTKPVTIPEIGICLDLLTHLSINRLGEVSVCVRFDPERYGVIGNIKNQTLSEIWNGEIRKHYIQTHLEGLRNTLLLCGKCHYWGYPTG